MNRQMSIGEMVDYAPPMVFGEKLDFEWLMTRAERIMLIHLLKQFTPVTAIEIGTYKGGSLQVISRYAKNTFTFDLDPKPELESLFSNVSFITGDSAKTLPKIIDQINLSNEPAGFVLIDGDHSDAGVRRDVEHVLKLQPRVPIAIVMHDSFNPAVRKGILAARWEACPWVHYVEIDFVPGIFLPGRRVTNRSMYGGFGFALLLPERRNGPLEIYQSQFHKFEICRRFAWCSGFMGIVSNRLGGAVLTAKSYVRRILRR
jgi:hypothetical protein